MNTMHELLPELQEYSSWQNSPVQEHLAWVWLQFEQQKPVPSGSVPMKCHLLWLMKDNLIPETWKWRRTWTLIQLDQKNNISLLHFGYGIMRPTLDFSSSFKASHQPLTCSRNAFLVQVYQCWRVKLFKTLHRSMQIKLLRYYKLHMLVACIYLIT